MEKVISLDNTYQILSLKEAEEYRKILLTIGEGEYSPTIIQDRVQYLWIVRRMYDNGMVIRIKCPHKKTVTLNEEGNAGVYCSDCGEKLSSEC